MYEEKKLRNVNLYTTVLNQLIYSMQVTTNHIQVIIDNSNNNKI